MVSQFRTNHALASKVPQVTLMFWVIKICATTVGETGGDALSMTLNLGYTVGIAITLAFFFVVLLTQLSVKKYIPVIYWLVIVGTTTLGTEISDFIDRTLHLGYTVGSALLVCGLLLTLFLWYRKYKNLEVFKYSAGIVLLTFLILSQVLYTLCTYLLWKRRYLLFIIFNHSMSYEI